MPIFSNNLKRFYTFVLLSMGAATSFLCFDYLLFVISPYIGKSRFQQGIFPGLEFIAHSVLLFLFAGLIMGIMEWMFISITNRVAAIIARKGNARSQIFWESMCAAGLALGGIIPISIQLFQGGGISRTKLAGPGPYLATILLFGIVFIIGYGWRRFYRSIKEQSGITPKIILIAIIGLLTFIAIYLIYYDNYRYPGQYTYLHNILLLLCFFSFQGIFVGIFLLLSFSLRSKINFLLLKFTPILIILVAVAQFLTFPDFIRDPRAKIYFRKDGMNYLKRLVIEFRELTDFDRDGFSAFLGIHDPRMFNSQIHPFAYDIPENGVDEDGLFGDCDREEIADYQVLWRGMSVPINGQAERALTEQTRDFNILLLTVDALRYDRTDNYNNSQNQPRFPHISKLIGDSIAFTRAYSHGTGTARSMPVLFTSHYINSGQSSDEETLVRNLHNCGYLTMMVTSSSPVETLKKAAEFDLSSGYDRVSLVPDRAEDKKAWGWGINQLSGEKITDEAVKMLSGVGQEKFFLWIHYMDVHQWMSIDDPGIELDRDDPVAAYDTLVEYTDREIGRLLAALRDRGLENNTIVILSADHGEGLGDKGIVLHTNFIINSLIHVPLSFKIPGLRPAKVTSCSVGLIDLMPTVLELAKCSPPSETPEGTNLLHLLTGRREPRNKPLYIDENYYKGILWGDYKFIYDVQMKVVQLFNIVTDYQENQDLWPKAEESLKRHLYYLFLTSPFYRLDREQPKNNHATSS